MLYTNRSRPGKLALCVLLVVHARSPVEALRANAVTQNTLPSAVRSGDRMLNELVAEGYTRSITFRRLVDGISATDALVYVEAGICSFGHLNACLLPFVAATGKGRYLRVILTQPLNLRNRNRLIALVGHELQHVLEVAERPEIVDVTGMMELGKRIGFPMKGRSGYETSAARAAGDAVFDELEASNRIPRPIIRVAPTDSGERASIATVRSLTIW
jgi:hypothetical protein